MPMPIRKKNLFAVLTVSLFASLAGLASVVYAQSASSSFGCTHDPYLAVGSTTINIRPSDVGRPGFIALGAELGNESAFLSSSGNWVYGRMPSAGEYRRFDALPATYTFHFCVPQPATNEWGDPIDGLMCSMTSHFAAGAALRASWGALTPEIEQQADFRESSIAASNARLISAGRAPRSFDRQRFIESAVLRDARMVNPVSAGSVPFIDCTPPPSP